MSSSCELLKTSPAAAPRRPLRRAQWALAAASVLALLVGLEFALRLYDCLVQGLPFFWDPALAAKKKTPLCNPFLLFRGPWQDYRTRAKTPEQIIEPGGRQLLRIVCLGGSTTQDMTAFVEEGITYPSELQRLLNERLGPDDTVVVETINAGFAAHSTLHMLVLLQTELLELKPDVVIVYENINDLMANYFPGPTTPAYANKFLHPYYLPPEMTVERATWFDHSRLYTWVRDRLRTVTRRSLRYTDEPVPLPHAEVFRRNLRSLVAVAQAHGIHVVLGQQALAADRHLFEKHFRSKSYNPDVVYPRIEQLVGHFTCYNRIIREVADEHGLLCVNIQQRLKDRHELFVDVVHLHAAGAREVADEFANRLWEDPGFQRLVAARRNQGRLAEAHPDTTEQ